MLHSLKSANEMLRLLPLWREPSDEIRGGVIPLGSADKQRRVGGCGGVRENGALADAGFC